MKGILFSGDMVKAILAGRKTQTRRAMNPQPPFAGDICYPSKIEGCWNFRAEQHPRAGLSNFTCRPRFRVGEIVYVKEAWASAKDSKGVRGPTFYRADDPNDTLRQFVRWSSSMFMPEWASRIKLEITAVRAERLQEMSYDAWCVDFCPDGAQREKALATFVGSKNQQEMARQLWDRINGPGSWEKNDFVWVYEFRRLTDEA